MTGRLQQRDGQLVAMAGCHSAISLSRSRNVAVRNCACPPKRGSWSLLVFDWGFDQLGWDAVGG
jgi:hypothetical protein